ncbi:MAG TPA: tetratricopeptide repeat protein [Pyrinomonadaceae bacterium]|jgi:tetratricopeptide (TPR) repeat protein
MQKNTRRLKVFLASAAILLFVCGSTLAQTTDFDADRDRAIRLVNAGNFAEALPLLEKLSAAKEADGQIFFGLGLAYWRVQETKKDRAEWKAVRLKARRAWLKAKELGTSVPEIDLIIASIKDDGGDRAESDNLLAQSSFDEATAPFAAGDYKTALAAYEKAATLDPKWYEAALYTGDTYYAMKDYDKAGVWFAKAIAIDPNRETAYRYWADGLAVNGKEKEAVERYLEAIVAEPYSSAAWRGLTQYAQRKNIKLAHPKIEIPVDFSATGNGNTKITLGIGDKTDDGSFAWTMYGISRAVWQTDKDGKLSESFSKAYPGEKVYRHSLAEEMDALHMVLTGIKKEKDAKKLSPSLALLKKLSDDGLLESFVLFVRADAGVKQDYPAYRESNRDKLKRYLADYVMKNGGN